MDEVLNINLLEEGFDDSDTADTEEDELKEAGMHVEGEEGEEVPVETELE